MWQWRMSCVTMNWSLIRLANKKTPPRLINFQKDLACIYFCYVLFFFIFFLLNDRNNLMIGPLDPKSIFSWRWGAKCTSLSHQPKEKHEMLIFISWSQHRHLCMWYTLTVIIWITQEKCNPVDGGRSLIDLISKKKCTEKYRELLPKIPNSLGLAIIRGGTNSHPNKKIRKLFLSKVSLTMWKPWFVCYWHDM